MLLTLEAAPSMPDRFCKSEDGKRFIVAGTIFEGPEAFKLVHHGYAEAADDECEEMASRQNPNEKGLHAQVHQRIMAEQRDFLDELEFDDDDDDDDDDE